MDEKNKNYLQYQGYLNTEHIFTEEINPLKQNLFSISSKKLPDRIEIKENLMLGKRVESYFKIQINNSETYQLLQENIQIQKEKRTIGELDFIIKDLTTAKVKHLEISYKFYLFDPTITGSEIDKWIGPNRNDNLVKKISKLSSQQFPLLYNCETKKHIHKTTENIQQELFFKAQLFIPLNFYPTKFHSINNKALVGFYISYKDFMLDSELTKHSFFIPKKQDWLIAPEKNTNWHSFETVKTELNASIIKQKSPLVWRKSKFGKAESLFITWW